MPSPLIKKIAVAAIVLGAAGAFFYWNSRPKPVAVVLKAADSGPVETTLSNTRAGTVEACQRTRLSTIVGGRIEVLAVKEGDRVKRGQLLLKLWNDDQSAQLRLSEAQLDTSRQRVNEACTVADVAEREAKRTSELRRQGFVSTSKEDTVRAEADAKRAACETARADTRQGEARVSATRVEQVRTRLVAPFDGVVAKIVGDLGEFTTPSPPGVATPPAIDLIDPSCLYVNAPMDEVDAPKIHPGLPARISIDALPNRPFAAKVKRVAPVVTAVEKQARTVDVEVRFDKPEEANGLLVGYSADVEIVLARRDKTLRIPTAAIQEGGRVLFFNPQTGRLEERKLKTGVANWEFTEVLEGLSEGDRVVTSLEREKVKAGAFAVPDEAEAPRASSVRK
jgi:HlyD family secretion protein